MTTASNKIAILARQPDSIFHVQDLARLWGIEKMDTLYTILKRYTQQGILFRIYKGFYSLLPIDRLDPLFLGIKALHEYAYVSTESVLVAEGLMAQIIHNHTLISSHSRRFQIGKHYFISRQLQDKFLYNPAGIIEKNGILMATKERAIADLLYFNPMFYFDGINEIDFSKVLSLQQEIGYPLTPIHNATTA
ncbi:MAG: hypothetical protein WC285_03605 [Candidatus Gracilibacteria bacterium]|jgi:predicted transcriptional regulator of viral defense system